ncbi:aldehyde ferredoxin oxidoreductase C-terminal domain-containing protein [Synergistes jonesii]|uniref:Aldehyde ferredoxin oxidoreductase N-terminal domain-containing protein n=1 Tax=Synergistes jonesii TaxID=2754 RepID=A0A073IQ25_9BACT|nr:aldehyde ferredoxin oxidoreductase C-terminal domain-containing protein [Synergistes jonesii]KEJ91546.1 hypothetical protein EH55_09060 [Synergistes jonesii]OFB60601.1 hypothetical protein JS73_10535 [Synergistes jonesii]OFB61585.1 hypothetical protein JS79_10685 [Synergistes jonesii]OFB65001.1 hypothetical protein JS72_03170 [Synergistes jonesii]OFB66798.1 hypothetical protein JS78_10560 [Synergistes jonesii]
MAFIFRVNMENKTVKKEAVPKAYASLGGRALITRIMVDETKPDIDALGKENKLIICPGLLGGTICTSTGRISIGGKSPLTQTLKESNAGGIVSQQLCRIGVKAIIIDDCAKKGEWYLLKVNADGIEFIDALEYVGKNNYELSELLKKRFDPKSGILSIGVAGERCYKAASVQVTSTNGYPSRAAARGGMGAVMGSKGLKAIVIDPPTGFSAVTYANKEAFLAAHKVFVEGVRANPNSGVGMPNLGTAVLVNPVNMFGMLPVNNYSSSKFDSDGVKKLSGEYIAEKMAARGGRVGHACNPGCIIHCSNEYVDENGKYVTSGLEYETLALCGSNCGIGDADIVAKMDYMCDDIGLDTMDIGAGIGVAMEGGKASFGDAEAAIAMLQEVNDGTEFGAILGNGAESVGKHLGVKRIPTVKGQAIAGYDPRSLKGTGVTYATCPQGADHTSGNLLGAANLNPIDKTGTPEASFGIQVAMCTMDSIGICIFASFCTADDPKYAVALADMLTALTGESWDVDRMMGLGVETIRLELEYNRAMGISKDKLPDFFCTEPNDVTGAVFDLTDEELKSVFPF